MSSASDYLRAARRKHADPAAIFETAEGAGLTARQLAKLVYFLRTTHPTWKLHKRQRDCLIDGLLDDNIKSAKISSDLSCNRKTVYRRAEARAASVEAPPVHGLNKRRECPKTDLRDGLDLPPILSFDATSGADFTEVVQRQFFAALGAT